MGKKNDTELNCKCIDIFYDIENKEISDTEKIVAIQHVLDSGLYKNITKEVIARAFKWYLNSEPQEVN